MRTGTWMAVAALAAVAWAGGGVRAQEAIVGGAPEAAPPTAARRAVQVLIPQSRAVVFDRTVPVEIEAVTVSVAALGPAATTTMDVSLRNPAGAAAEAVLLLPVPDGAVVRAFDFQGASAEPTASILPREEARRTYESIVRRAQDPALLEFAGATLLRSSVFPVPASGTQRVRVVFEHLLAVDGARTDLLLPRSETAAPGARWTIEVDVKSALPLATAYSPSHAVETTRASDRHLRVRVSGEAAAAPGPFRLSWLAAGDAPAASLFAYPDPARGGGHFLLLAGLPPHAASAATAVRREVTVVLDRSGSMSGGKLDQAREAALQVIEGLDEGEWFNVLDYSDSVARMAPTALRRDGDSLARARAYLASLRPSGGTNLHDALAEALAPATREGSLPLVLFLTDGLPTVGRTRETDIRGLAESGNPHRRRVFTFGVGADVNAPLLDRVAEVTRAAATYVLPGESVEAKVGETFRRLRGPVLASGSVVALDGGAELLDLEPARLPDLFEGDSLVLLGRWRGTGPLRLRLAGDYLGTPRAFQWSFDLASASTRNGFVPRLWASRRIACLVDRIRQDGADPAATTAAPTPAHREIVQEIVHLSREFGVLTEYTAFFAAEGTDLSDGAALLAQAGRNLQDRAVATRSGAAGVNQSLNYAAQSRQQVLNASNAYVDENLRRVEIAGVAQVSDRAFYRRGEDWVDARVLDRPAGAAPPRAVAFGSEEHLGLVRALVAEGRASTAALRGGIVLDVGGEVVRLLPPAATPE